MPRSIREAAGVQPGDIVTFRTIGPGRIELSVLPRLTLAELLDKYHIEGPIDWVKDREAWKAEAAKDVISGLRASPVQMPTWPR
ncbi:MAG: hypothetical protein ACRDI2_24685 [Chloroflexota bacterium]